MSGGSHCLFHCFLLVHASQAVLLVPGGHQDGVVNGSAKLNGGDQNRSHEGQLCARVIRDAQVGSNGQLDNRYQQHWQGEGLLHQQDDHENGDDGNQADHGEIMISAGDQVLRTGCFTDQHAALVILFQNAVQAVDLSVDFIGGNHIGGVDQHQLIPLSLYQGQNIIGNNGFRDARAKQAVDPNHAPDAVHLPHFFRHIPDVLLTYVTVHQQQVGGGHIEGFFQLLVGNHGFQLRRHDLAHVIIHIHMVVAIERREDHNHQHHGQRLVMFGDEASDAAHIGKQRLVGGLFDRAVQQADHTGQQNHRAQQAHDHAFAHDNTQILAQGKAHEADGNEARDGGQAGAQDGSKGQVYCFCHGLILVCNLRFLFLVAVPQEDGIVQRHAQLQYSGHSLGDIADLAQEVIASHVPQDAYTDAGKEDQRQQETVHGDHQHQSAQRHGNAHVNRFLLFHQLLGIRHYCGQTADEALFTSHLAHLVNRFHGFLGRRTFIEKYSGKHAVAPLEHFPNIRGDNFDGEHSFGDGSKADHAVHMGDFFQRVFHIGFFGDAHALRDQQGKGPFAKILKQDFLTLHRLQVLRQVIQKIIFCLGGCHAKHRGNHQRNAQDDDHDSMLDQPFGEAFHILYLPTRLVFQTLC